MMVTCECKRMHRSLMNGVDTTVPYIKIFLQASADAIPPRGHTEPSLRGPLYCIDMVTELHDAHAHMVTDALNERPPHRQLI